MNGRERHFHITQVCNYTIFAGLGLPLVTNIFIHPSVHTSCQSRLRGNTSPHPECQWDLSAVLVLDTRRQAPSSGYNSDYHFWYDQHYMFIFYVKYNNIHDRLVDFRQSSREKFDYTFWAQLAALRDLMCASMKISSLTEHIRLDVKLLGNAS